ncbi:MAG TPA: 4'-phosphopantetheinyl transferase superfamily protein [Solirubrobacterales bacterium]|nr:4'-phosphopantetheinyl transferase superfamily protein [Solirubrobacterales bacterium]
MIEEILPPAVSAVEAFADVEATAALAEEIRQVANAVEKRRREFLTGRDCAHRALEGLGLEREPIPSGSRGEPIWPAGAVGSITHCDGYRAAVVGQARDFASIGIDAEPLEPLPPGILEAIALPAERAQLAGLAARDANVEWGRLLFCAKEAVYKAWFPLAGRMLGFEDAELTFDRDRGSFHARLLVPGPRLDGVELRDLQGRWLARGGHVLAAIALSR